MVSPPSVDGLARVPAGILDAAITDTLCQRDKARGERSLFAAPGTIDAQIGDAREAVWRAQNAGLAQLLDWASGPPQRG